MNKSTNNRDFVDQPRPGIVSRAEIGRRVLVNGRFSGVLRYLGPVGGRQGIFCGVELDQPVGKNDGTHQGVFYFDCQHGHGIFAPCHKVQLENESDLLERKEGCPKEKLLGVEALSRSATAALPFEASSANANKEGQRSDEGQQAPMDWSLMSVGSTLSGCSLARFEEDMMAHSQATYTVFESDCMMLSDLELGDSTLLRLDEEEEAPTEWMTTGNLMSSYAQRNNTGRMDESMILDGPTLGLELLPVIGSPEAEETPTPMAECTNFAAGLHSGQQREREEDRRNRNHLALGKLVVNGKETTTTETAGYDRGNLVKSHPPTQNKSGQQKGRNDANNNREVLQQQQIDSGGSPQSQQQQETLAAELRTGGGKKRPMQQQVSVFQSVPMPAQNLSAAARAKPKQPSKAQLIMEQLKASMEAEKHRPKKEVRSKVGIAEDNTDGMEEQQQMQQSDDNKTAGKSEKALAHTDEMLNLKKKIESESANSKNKNVRQTTTTKQILIRPATKETTSNPNVASSRGVSEISRVHHPPVNARQPIQQRAAVVSSAITPSSRPKSRYILGSKENTASTASATSAKSPSTAHPPSVTRQPVKSSSSTIGTLLKIGRNRPPADEQPNATEQELARTRKLLAKNKEVTDIFIILSSHLSNQASVADSQANNLRQLLEKEREEHLRSVEEVEGKWQQKCRHMKEQHQTEIEHLRSGLLTAHGKDLAIVQEKCRAAVDELEGQVELLNARHEEQEREHQEALKATEHERNRKLANELQSREYELQLKNEELTKLRTENRALLLQTEQIPDKDAQILRMERKNDDLRENVNRLKQIERKLLAQLDQYRHELGTIGAKTKEMEKEKEVLEYQLNEHLELSQHYHPSTPTAKSGSTATDSDPGSAAVRSPALVDIRTPEQRRKSAEKRPNSSCLSHGRQTTANFVEDMSRSMDSALCQSVISCYRAEGRSKSQNTPNKIFTPRDCYELNDPRRSAKRTVAFDECELESPKSHD